MTWQPVTYDPELNLDYVTTGNPQPVIAHKNRPGDNLFTGSIVALNADTGKMVWYFQSSPHDTHDWDSNETPVLFDGTINGQPRKLLAQAARNGHFFVLDRDQRQVDRLDGIRQDELVDSATTSAASRSRTRRRCRRSTARSCRRTQGGATNWYSPSFSPQTGLFYVNATPRLQRVLPLRSERQPGRLGRQRSRRLVGVDAAGDRLQDRQDPLEPSVEAAAAATGILSTAGNVRVHRRLRRAQALNATTGAPLWHSRLHADQQRADHLRARWLAVCCGRCRQLAGGVRAQQVNVLRAVPSRQSPVASRSPESAACRAGPCPEPRMPSPESRVPSRIPRPESRVPNLMLV